MKMRVPESHRSIWIANLAAAVAGHGTLHHFSSSPGLFRQMSVCGWQRQGIYPLSPLTLLLLIQIWVRGEDFSRHTSLQARWRSESCEM